MPQAISANEFTERIQNGETINLLDVREVIEFSTYNIGGRNMPLSKLASSMNELDYNKIDEIVVICKIGMRSKTACTLLQENGYQNVRNLAGGLIALQKINNKNIT
ncbi:rhodanese-like domain-containing protein [Mucilaginibacter sp.]